MKDIRLKSLELTNFKGIGHFCFEPDGDNAAVYGDNATGKSSLVDAFMFLLFDKDSHGKTDFEIKTIESGSVVHGLNHTVEAALLVDGEELRLKKVYKEKWTKKRGQVKQEFTGHTTDYAINGVPKKKTEFKAAVSDLVDEDVFRLLTDPRHFNNLHWEKRREIIMEVCGDVSDADVIASNKALAELPDILGRRSLEDHKKVVVSRRQEINKRLAEIPVRIDETNNGKPDTSDIKMTRDGIEAEIKKLKDRKASKEKERSQVKDGGPSTDLYTKHTRAERELTRAKAEFSSDQDRRSRDQEKQLYDIDTRVKELTAEQDRLAKSMRDNMAAASEFQDRLECLRKEWHQVNGTAMESPDVSDTCPTCGQGLPQDQVEAAKQKALEAFNFEKAAKLKQITAAGKRTSEKLKETEKLIEATDTRSKEINAEIDSLADERTKVQAKIDEIAAEKFEDTEKAKKLQAEVARLQAEIDKLDSGDNAEAIAKIDEEIRAIEEQLNTNQVALATLDHVDKADARIKELEAEQKKLSDEFEQMEKELYLTEQFTAAKANMLEEKINSHFNRARFRLFEQQINEGIKDTCATLCDGVPYPSANNAAQTQVGLDIINTLADFYQFRAPIWIDNAEAITRLPDIDSQLIELVVDERYPELTVFKAERPKQKKAS